MRAVEKFQTSEEAWFWYCRCQTIRLEGARFESSRYAKERPCDPDDIVIAATVLYRCNIISRSHLLILVRYGTLERCPIEEGHFKLWTEALDRLATVLAQKGIIECP